MLNSTIREQINRLHAGTRPRSLVNAAGYLVLSAMRIDPTNPNWMGGDILFYSESYAEVLREVFRTAGCSDGCLPRPGFAALPEAIEKSSPTRRIYCLMDNEDAENFPSLRAPLRGNVIVLSPEMQQDTNRWEVQTYSDLTLDILDSIHTSHQIGNSQALWVVAPISGERYVNKRLQSSVPGLADRMSRLGTETAFDVLNQVHQLRAQGRDIVSFGLGEPDFDSPVHVKDTAKRAIEKNETHYGPSAGLPELREAIARYIQRTRHVPCDPAEVVVTPGAKPIVFDVMMALLNPGDEVLYPNPGYPIYESVIEWVGGTAVSLPLLEANNWNFTVEELARRITPRTKMIVINTPGNPTGTCIGPEELREIARLANEYNLWVIADEIYSQIVWDTEFHSIVGYPGMKERTIIVDGFSKTYAMTGWRLGYGVMNRDLAVQVAKIETNIDSCTCTFTQIAGISALDGPQHESLYMVEQFKARSKAIVDGLNKIEGVKCLPAQGAFYVFPNVTGACRKLGLKNANELQQALLHEAGVAVLPRTCFGRRLEGENQEYIRLSFATSMENIREGLRRMKQYIEK